MLTNPRPLAALLALAFSAGLAAAQDKPADPTLKGPEVKDNSLPGQKRSFGEGNRERKTGDRPTPLPVIMKALDVLRGERAGDLKLSDEQDAKLKAALADFQKATRDYLEQHRDEIASLRAQVSPEDRARFDQALGGEGRALRANKNGFKGKPKDAPKDADEAMKPDAQPMTDPADSAKARARLLEILAARPKPEDAHAKAWAVLSEPQRAAVQAEIAKLQKPKEKPPTDALPDLKDKSADEIMNDPRLPERLRERLRNMTPQDREQAIQRLKERAAQGGRPNRPGAAGGSDKPAPKPSDVNVPAQPK